MSQLIGRFMTDEYLFHGSTRNSLTELVPNKPHGAGQDQRDKEVAVYATEDVAGAIIFSLIGGLRGTFSVVRSQQGETVACFSETLRRPNS